MSSPLERISDLRSEQPDRAEFVGLQAAGASFLADAQNAQLSLSSRFTLAYDAAYAYSLSALRYCGFRAKNRYIVFQALPHTLALGPEIWRVLAKAQELRNAAQYHGDFSVDDRVVIDLLGACRAVRDAVERLPPLK